MNEEKDYQVLLYYKYSHISDPEGLMRQQRELCERLDIKGRILIAHEGINGTLEGTKEAVSEYCRQTDKMPDLADIWYKRSPGTGNAFPKLSVKVREEVVTTKLEDDNFHPQEVTGKYLSADELHQWFVEGREFYIVDMRNDFEQKAGHFQGSVFSGMKNFRDLKETLPRLLPLKDKTVVTVCTGGIRCEKASGFLVRSGFSDVYQLHGGIVTYMEKYPNQHFKGKLYVFDGRILMGFNTDAPDHEVVGRCDLCGGFSENFINCADLKCHKHFICCDDCMVSGGYCSPKCQSTLSN